jgi:hypothetical protein
MTNFAPQRDIALCGAAPRDVTQRFAAHRTTALRSASLRITPRRTAPPRNVYMKEKSNDQD